MICFGGFYPHFPYEKKTIEITMFNGKIKYKPTGKWENHRKTIEKLWENYGKMEVYLLVNVYITMENHHFYRVNSVQMVMFNSYVS